MTEDGRNLLVIGAPEHDAHAHHLSGFLAPDDVICLRVNGKTYLAVSSLEYGRARKSAPVDVLLSYEEMEITKLSRKLRSGARGYAAAIRNLLDDLGASDVPLATPNTLAVGYADALRDRGLALEPDGRLFDGLRRAKTPEEVVHVEAAQRAVEASCGHAVDILREADVADDGTLQWRGGVLTSEILRSEINVELLRRNCLGDGTIAAGGSQAADPHERGTGSLKAGEAIILDIFPMDLTSRYYADMTRTFVKGEPNGELQAMYDAVLESQEAALAMIGPGVDGKDVHEKVCQVLHDKGYKTQLHDRQEGKPLTEGFFHGTGHGVGLEIHEAPRLGLTSEKLVPGDIVSVEPGLYYPEAGGVRIEDLVLVTEDGSRNLTRFPKKFEL